MTDYNFIFLVFKFHIPSINICLFNFAFFKENLNLIYFLIVVLVLDYHKLGVRELNQIFY